MSKKKQYKKVTLLWGLPGSGKTTYKDKTIADSRAVGETVDSIDVDSIGRYAQQYHGSDGAAKEVVRQVGIDTAGKLNYKDRVVIDGLVTTNSVAWTYFAFIKLCCAERNMVVAFDIIWWTPDREACKHNDQGRRKLDSTVTIDNMPFEEPSEALLKEFGVTTIRKEVVMKPAHKVWAGKVGWFDSDTIESETWCLGGTWGDYNGHRGSVSPSAQPANFDRFDELLEEICPQISFLQYKKIYRDCVTIKESSSSDYYGGTTNYACYVCDVKKLHEMLVELGVVQ